MLSQNSPLAPLETLRVRSEGRLETIENAIVLYRQLLDALEGRAAAPTTSLDGFDASTAEAVRGLEQLGEHEPSPQLEEVLATWGSVRAVLAEAASKRLEALKVPPPDGFSELFQKACATLHFEFDRPVVDLHWMLLRFSPFLLVAVLAIVELARFANSEWTWFPRLEWTLVVATIVWNVRRVRPQHVRLTVLGVHAADRFVSFKNIRAGWIGSGGEVVIETHKGEQLGLETEHAVELQRVLMHHGVKLTTLARR
jgi:hypothetical protein